MTSPRVKQVLYYEYNGTAVGPFVGASCYKDGCGKISRFAVTTLGGDPYDGTPACAVHLAEANRDILATGNAAVVQEIPVRTSSYTNGGKRRRVS